MCSFNWGAAADIVRTLVPVASLGVVVIGWYLVNRQNNLRESRKETRQLIDRSQEFLAEAIEIAVKYQSSSGDASPPIADAWRLILALEQLGGSLNTLRKKGIAVEECNVPFNNLKKCITGADFMTEGWKPWQHDDKRWLDLVAETKSLTQTLERTFISSFKD
jgi:inosine-uridine nucleoside N-ribohydrolase